MKKIALEGENRTWWCFGKFWKWMIMFLSCYSITARIVS